MTLSQWISTNNDVSACVRIVNINGREDVLVNLLSTDSTICIALSQEQASELGDALIDISMKLKGTNVRFASMKIEEPLITT